MPVAELQQIEHIVVLMLENRSFDNLLGWLYDPANPSPFNQTPPPNFEGLFGKPLSNPGPNGPVPVGKGSDPTIPNPDPGEPYEDVFAQLYLQKQDHLLSIAEVPPAPDLPCQMEGFLYNYSLQPKVTNPKLIMNCFTPSTVPVLSSLAYYYGVCDHWFSSIPTQTICNRSFVHAGTSSGYVNNQGGDGILLLNDTPTIFNLLSDAKKTWKIYHGGSLLTSLALLTQRRVWPYALTGQNFSPIKAFYADARRQGGLPNYSFIEPNYMDSLRWGAENDMHPESHPFDFFGPSNIDQGEGLVYSIYTALRNSPDWNKTLLIITFDEHGGCYDHVCPPTSASKDCNLAVPPDNNVIPREKPGGSGFKFDRLGVRVPAIVVSPFTPPQTIVNRCFEHTSVLSTVVNRFTLAANQLGARQNISPDVSDALKLSAPRDDRPPIPRPTTVTLGFLARIRLVLQSLFRLRSKQLTGLQRDIVRAAAHRLEGIAATSGLTGFTDHRMEADAALSVIDAEKLLIKLEADLMLKKMG